MNKSGTSGYDRFVNTIVAMGMVAIAYAALRDSKTEVDVGGVAPLSGTYYDAWTSYAAAGHRVGPTSAPLQLLVLSDYQCPFCRRLHGILAQVQAAHPGDVSVTYLHFPLNGHPKALPAARAAECAAAQDRFAEYSAALFAHADSLAVVSWISLAMDVGVRDSAGFAACLAGGVPDSIIRHHRAIGDSVGLRGTPTLLVNGWKLSRQPSVVEIDSMLMAVRSGKAPLKWRR